MSKTLFLFLFSSRPDGYINAIAHAFDHMHVEAIKLVYVKGARTGLNDNEATAASNQIWARLEELTTVAEIYKRIFGDTTPPVSDEYVTGEDGIPNWQKRRKTSQP